jgi:hypothetical protein
VVRAAVSSTEVSWNSPVANQTVFGALSSITLSLSPTHAPGSVFPLGQTEVQYLMEWTGSEQLNTSLVSCTFPVCSAFCSQIHRAHVCRLSSIQALRRS